MIRELSENPYCYLHMSKNHLLRPGVDQKSSDFFENAKAHLNYLVENQIIESTSADIYYIYRQTVRGVTHTGIIGLCDIADYQNGLIRKHELTKPVNEDFISRYIEATGVIGEPLLVSHFHKQSLEDLLLFITQSEASLSYTKGERQHEIWIVDEPDLIDAIGHEASEIERFYIMDGHHRAASVSNLFHKHQSEAYRYCATFLVDSNQLEISPFHRFIEVDSITSNELLSVLSKTFELEPLPEYALRPEAKGEFVLRCSAGSYKMTPKQNAFELDVMTLEQTVIGEVFGIRDSRIDDRVRFISSEEELGNAVLESGAEGKYLFMLHPCTFDEVAKLSDTTEFMPPKSTFVEPKNESGLFIQPYGTGFKPEY